MNIVNLGQTIKNISKYGNLKIIIVDKWLSFLIKLFFELYIENVKLVLILIHQLNMFIHTLID